MSASIPRSAPTSPPGDWSCPTDMHETPDGIFYRGAFHFGSAPDSVRFRHIRKRPQVSAVHLPAEELAVSVHGRAVLVDVSAPENQEFRQTVLDIYVPRYGPEWERDIMDAGA